MIPANNSISTIIIIFSSCLLFISHGACEHMGRYNLLAEYLAAEGILVFGHDHGKNKTFTHINRSVLRNSQYKNCCPP